MQNMLDSLIVFASLCKAIYLPDEEARPEIKAILGDVEIIFFHTKDGVDGCLAIAGSHASLIFRGTESKADALHDLNILKTKAFGGAVHRGFYEGYLSARDFIVKTLSDNIGITSLTLCGHSYAGAISEIAALDLSPIYKIQVVYTFGCPRVFDRSAAREYNKKLGEKTFNVINASDPVARVPSALRFSRVGKVCFIPSMLCHLKPGDPPFATWNWKMRLKSAWQDFATGGGLITDHFCASYVDKLKTIKRLLEGQF